MKKISNSFYNKIENNNKNQYYKIGYYNPDAKRFEEVVRFRNSYNKDSGANYGLLQIWSCTFDFAACESQGGWNTCGGYNKPIANLEGCLYQLKEAIENHELTDCGAFDFSGCGSVVSLLEGLRDYLQTQYALPLFLMDCNG